MPGRDTIRSSALVSSFRHLRQFVCYTTLRPNATLVILDTCTSFRRYHACKQMLPSARPFCSFYYTVCESFRDVRGGPNISCASKSLQTSLIRLPVRDLRGGHSFHPTSPQISCRGPPLRKPRVGLFLRLQIEHCFQTSNRCFAKARLLEVLSVIFTALDHARSPASIQPRLINLSWLTLREDSKDVIPNLLRYTSQMRRTCFALVTHCSIFMIHNSSPTELILRAVYRMLSQKLRVVRTVPNLPDLESCLVIRGMLDITCRQGFTTYEIIQLVCTELQIGNIARTKL